LLDGETPVAAMDYIEAHSLTGNIFHPQIYGDYLIWRLWPDQRSFFDGRVHAFGESIIRDYRRMFRDSDWAGLAEKYDIRYLLLSKGRHGGDSERLINDARHSPSWAIVHEDDLSVLFEKRTLNRPTSP
jgi:hypothetical protein